MAERLHRAHSGDRFLPVTPIRVSPLPAQALLSRYADAGAYTDCFAAEIGRPVSQAKFVEAFYTSPAFMIERMVLGLFLAKPFSHAQARQLAAGELSVVSAWRVEDRNASELLMCDFLGRTRSWLMVAATSEQSTCLYFGSAVVPGKGLGRPVVAMVSKALLGLHKLYSRVLLGSARRRLVRARELI